MAGCLGKIVRSYGDGWMDIPDWGIKIEGGHFWPGFGGHLGFCEEFEGWFGFLKSPLL